MSQTTRTTQTKSLPTDKFLTIAINLMNTAVLEATRTDAKKLYRELEAGKAVPLTHLQMEDKSLVRFDLALNHEQYQGNYNFGNFKTGLTLLISNIIEALKAPQTLQTFRNEADSNSLLFSVPAVTVEDGKPSVLFLGAESGTGEPLVTLQLTYLDNVQFEEQAAAPDDKAPS